MTGALPGPRGRRPTMVARSVGIAADGRSVPGGDEVSAEELAEVGLLLPSRIHTIRKVVDAAFQRVSLEPRVVGEIESVLTLTSAISADLGATVLPWSAARAILDVRNLVVRRIVNPTIEVK